MNIYIFLKKERNKRYPTRANTVPECSFLTSDPPRLVNSSLFSRQVKCFELFCPVTTMTMPRVLLKWWVHIFSSENTTISAARINAEDLPAKKNLKVSYEKANYPKTSWPTSFLRALYLNSISGALAAMATGIFRKPFEGCITTHPASFCRKQRGLWELIHSRFQNTASVSIPDIYWCSRLQITNP